MKEYPVYLECPNCGRMASKSRFIRGKFDPGKDVVCPTCGEERELSEWNWFWKVTSPHWVEIPSSAFHRLAFGGERSE